MPKVEHEPHFLVMRLTRTIRGSTFNRHAHCFALRRRNSRWSLDAFIASIAEQNHDDPVHKIPPRILVEVE